MGLQEKFQRSKKPCSYPGCRTLVADGGSRCEVHRVTWAKGPNEPKRMKGRALQEARERLFRGHPLCAECERQGRVRAAVVRDHIVPMGEGGEDTDDNTQGLCHRCHDEKTEAERRRGIQRI